MTNNLQQRLPAEWEEQKAVLMAWPHADTDWAYMLDEVRQCCNNIIKATVPYAKVLLVCNDKTAEGLAPELSEPFSGVVIVNIPTNDTWARDFGPIFTCSDEGWRCNDFKFNGWGLKFPADRDNLITRRILEHAAHEPAAFAGLLKARYANRLGFVLEGGSFESDGNGTLLTTAECLLSPNRNGDLNRGEIECRLKEYFGVRKVLWLEHGALEGDDTDSHIDTLARLVPGGRILYSSCDRPDDSHYGELSEMAGELAAITDADGKSYELFALPIPRPIYDEDGNRLPATYANFLIINNAVIMPVYGDEHYDRIAANTVAAAMPGYEIVEVDCRALIKQHGSLHCMTMQMPIL